jgi:hypothetical protein
MPADDEQTNFSIFSAYLNQLPEKKLLPEKLERAITKAENHIHQNE